MTNRQDQEMNKKLIFFAEDDDDNADIVREMLEGFGCEAVRASHGKELLVLADIRVPNMILLDLEMPVMNGYATLAILRQDTRFQDIPIVAMSGKIEPNLLANLETAGFAAFLAKPFNKSHLGQLLLELRFEF